MRDTSSREAPPKPLRRTRRSRAISCLQPVNPHADRTLTETDDVSNVALGDAVHVHHQHGAIDVAEARRELLQDHQRIRVARRRGDLGRLAGDLARVPSAIPAHEVDGGVQRDTVDPGVQAGAPLEPIEAPPQLQRDLLIEIFPGPRRPRAADRAEAGLIGLH